MEYIKPIVFIGVIIVITMYPVYRAYFNLRQELKSDKASQEIMDMVTSNDVPSDIDQIF